MVVLYGSVLMAMLQIRAVVPPASSDALLAGETCETAIDLGAVPPDRAELGMTVPGHSTTWRSFTLTSARLVQGTGQGSEVWFSLSGDCGTPLAAYYWHDMPMCLVPGTYHLAIENPLGPTASVDLRVEDLGPCFPTRGLLARAVGLQDLDGDRDSFADTGETVRSDLEISNKSAIDLTSVHAVVATTDPKIECVPPFEISLGALAAHSTVVPATPLVFRVAPTADRAAAGRAVGDDYSASLTVTLTADQLPVPVVQTLRFDLDLNVTAPVVATSTFVEGFENGFGAFVFQNLDANRASNTLSYGYRCQYSPPRINCGSDCCDPEAPCDCWLGFETGQTPVNDWHIHTSVAPDGGRAFVGAKSLHYGKHTPGNPDLDTYGLAQLDAVRTSAAIPLAARICASDPAQDKRSCNDASDCLPVGGGACVGASPELSLAHQVSTVDARFTNTPPGEAADRAVVQVQRAPSGLWEDVEAFENLRDVQGTDAFSNCMFDPIDDGNDETSYFDPNDPQHSLGPSSTCMPEFAFSYLGDTDGPFDPQGIGRASDGPGLQGSVGPGTWVRSRFDLSRYRGFAVRVRFLFTSIRVDEYPDHQSSFSWNPNPSDDGWYVDDVRITQTLGASTPTVSLDNAAPPPGDPDGDGVATCADCGPLDPGVWSAPADTVGLRLAGSSPTTLAWTPPAAPGATALTYDVLRSDDPADFSSAVCLASSTAALSAADPGAHPAEGAVYSYLVRTRNACGENLGAGSSGVPRQGPGCP